MIQLDKVFIARLKALGPYQETACEQEEGVDAIAGGNIDDAYGVGLDDGEVMLAREVLTQLDIEWN